MKHHLDFYKAPKQNFTKEMVNDTLKYQKLYGFYIDENDLAVDNESDAFRHAYMQAYLSLNYGGRAIAKMLGDNHEKSGRLSTGQYTKSSNMDLWNNQQGRQIAIEIRREYPNFGKLSMEQKKDIIAGKVIQKMKSGQLITNLEDKRRYIELKPVFTPMPWIGGIRNNGTPLGFGASIDNGEFVLQQPLRKQSILSGYNNPLSGDNRIFTREEVASMSPEEFKKHEKEIDAQTMAFNGTMPTNADLRLEVKTGGVIYVEPYTRSNGTEVKGYYRSR